jgi:hypothetical protein
MSRYAIVTILSLVFGVSVVSAPMANAAVQKRAYIVTVHHRSDIDEVVEEEEDDFDDDDCRKWKHH